MSPITPELIAIVSVGATLAGLILTGQRSLRGEIGELRSEISALRDQFAKLRERMAHLEGLLEELREAISGKRAA